MGQECGRSYLGVAHLLEDGEQSISVRPERVERPEEPGHVPEHELLPGHEPLPAGGGAGGYESGHACVCGHAEWPGLELGPQRPGGLQDLLMPRPQVAHAL